LAHDLAIFVAAAQMVHALTELRSGELNGAADARPVGGGPTTTQERILRRTFTAASTKPDGCGRRRVGDVGRPVAGVEIAIATETTDIAEHAQPAGRRRWPSAF
jgi:hypothetical protein